MDETVGQIVCECPMLAQSEHKRRHDWAGRKIHCRVCRKIGFDVNEKWHEHEQENVVENDSWKILWDVAIQTDYVNEARRPDMVIIGKTKNVSKVIDFACPFDGRIEQREKGKMKSYNDLERELKEIWDRPVKVIPAVIGALGKKPKKLKIKAAVEWYRDWDKNGGIVENYYLIFCRDPSKCSWALRSLVDTEPQEI